MENLLSRFKAIRLFILDVDGVLTDGRVLTLPDGDQIRSMNIKDGFALQHAVKQGYKLAIISGGRSESVRKRLNSLGIEDIYLSCREKEATCKKLLKKYKFESEKVMYMGDDLPDIPGMKLAGLACAPKDAVAEIKALADYISPFNGGKGCVRDVIEKVLKLNSHWPA
jgi:3-deoxy-D-manno-octulosonate 8-phosphate phosphatase (KDO 8-P phosphatase)